jgi:hypothetical protein
MAVMHSSRSGYVPCLQHSLAAMVVAGEGTAVTHLRFANFDNDPWVMLIHLWPIFDPLRGPQDFNSLLREVFNRPMISQCDR